RHRAVHRRRARSARAAVLHGARRGTRAVPRNRLGLSESEPHAAHDRRAAGRVRESPRAHPRRRSGAHLAACYLLLATCYLLLALATCYLLLASARASSK